ncbi:MAG TPA: TetR family transcriptional regulator [Acidimicrobiales bacterium]|jgi:AcrR family transcriptional regulator|nr:TetR family transcriptional regulator [Acidimicrobiales bacterium]
MGRWEPDAKNRLEQAALDLYGDGGFEQTTVAEIAKRAGLTERTFFRYFSDKREVLFAGADRLKAHLVDQVTEAPASATPIEAVANALEVAASLLQENREFAQRRQNAITTNDELQERELIKLASLAAAMASALRERGVKEPTASLTGETGIAVFKVAFERWTEPSNEVEFTRLIRDSLRELRLLTADDSPS